MMTLIVALLIQAPQEASVEERVARFVKGDAAAGESLLALGAGAIIPLQKARDKNPEKVDALVIEIKKRVRYPKKSKVSDAVAQRCTIDLKDSTLADAVAYLHNYSRAPLFYDAFDAAGVKVDVVVADTQLQQVLDQLCRAGGLDYGFFHNAIVIAKPERLWPGGKTAPAFGPPAVERQHRTPDEDKVLSELQALKVSLDFQNATVKSMAAYVQEISGVPFDVADPAAKPIPVFRFKDASVLDALALATQLRDLDFVVKGRKVIVGTRAEIEKKLR